MFIPERSCSGSFVFSVDHCFPIRGQGTVMTGTVLSGSVNLNDVSLFYIQLLPNTPLITASFFQ